MSKVKTKGRGKPQVARPLDFVVNAAIGSLVALGVTLALLFAASALVVSGWIPEGLMGIMTTLLFFIGSFAGATVAIRKSGARALLVGLFQGGILYAITVVGGAFAESPSLFGGLSPILFVAAILGGGLAGLLWRRPRRRGD